MAKLEFPSYVSDCPSYCGPVEIELNGQAMSLITHPEGERYARRLTCIFAITIPGITEAREATPQEVGRLWAAFDDADKSYYESPKNVPVNRLKWLRFVDGTEGAVLLGGEVCFVSVYVLHDGLPLMETMDFESSARVLG